MEGRVATCERCGAVLALGGAGWARCVYCLHDQRLPPDIAAPLVESRVLVAQLDLLRRQRDGSHSSWITLAVIVAMSVPGLAIMGYLSVGVLLSAEADPVMRLAYGVFGLGSVAMFIAIPVAWSFVQRRAYRLRLAALPTAIPVVQGEQLLSSCPRCGAPHGPPSGGLTMTCLHCGAEALVPLPLVAAKLARIHRRVFEARQHVSLQQAAGYDAVATWQKYFVPAILIFVTVVFGGGIAVLVVLGSMR